MKEELVAGRPNRRRLGYYVASFALLVGGQILSLLRLLQTTLNDDCCSSSRRLVGIAPQYESLRYFVLDVPEITRMDIRENVLTKTNATWEYTWGQRFRDEYAAWEIRFLQALENHPDRTFDVESADYFVLPLPVGGIMTYGAKKDLHIAMDAIAHNPIFRAHSDKFVLISLVEFIFIPGGKEQQAFLSTGWRRKFYRTLQNITLVKDIDIFAWNAFQTQFPSTDWGPVLPSDMISFTRHAWSLGYSGAASDPALDLVIPTYDEFVKRKYEIFYHTTRGDSLFNSTGYRHAPILHAERLPQPSSVGFDIAPSDWKKHFGDSKYCLVIRGDNPTSRALWRTIRQGCIPLIVSNALPYYGPSMRTQMDMSRYSIFIREKEFLADPAGAIQRATKLSESALREKINDLALFQRMIIVDHPKTLFVPSFGRETMASLGDSEGLEVLLEPKAII